MPNGSPGILLAARLDQPVEATCEHKPPVQRNYSAHWTFDTMPLELSRKLIAIYWGYVTLIDFQVGRMIDALDRLGVTDETAVIFSADHGEFTASHARRPGEGYPS
jgi:arylsulfatase A-like enzyme